MSAIATYRLRAASVSALHAALVGASAGKARPYAWTDELGDRFDEARVRLPFVEAEAGAPETDPETGETLVPQIPTGFWLCEVALVDEVDPDLAAIAIN